MKRHYIKHTYKLVFLLFAFLFSNSSSLFAQSSDNVIRCIAVENEQSRLDEKYQEFFDKFEKYIRQQRRNIRSESVQNYTIPVIFHIIHDNDALGTGDNLATQYINAQLDQINNDFRKIAGTSGDGGGIDTGIEFCMATIDENGNALTEPGINRIDRNTQGWTAPPYGNPGFGCFSPDLSYIDNTIKPQSQWNPEEYLNIWVLDVVCGILGYAQFPEASTLPGIGTGNGPANSDGVVVIPSSVGSTDVPNPDGGVFDAGRTLTHEIGHFFGLRHIWGDGGCNVDDFCADTPNAGSSTSGCPANKDSCPGDGPDQIENYMDYSNDACMERFTADQTDRMQIVMGATGIGSPRRESLANSPACGNANPNPSFSITATNSPVTVTQPDNAVFDFNVAFSGGFSGSVTLSASGLPSGLSASFSSNPVTSAGAYSMTVSGTSNVAAGTYNFSIDGTDGGSLNDSEVVTLVVQEQNTGGGDCNTFTSSANVTIPNQTTVTSTIHVGTNGTVSDVNVSFNGEHDAVRDLIFELVSPAGTNIQLVDLDDPCNRQDDFDLGFDDQATQTISDIPCPPTSGDSYQPEEALSAFNGESSGGTWTLRITDDRRRFEGQLQGWSIEVCTGNATPPTCDDGIQNGDEEGVDCGGSDCPPCTTDPTCDDGIQNGLETGVDCGGPDCPPCTTDPTCDDGIQNGLETGVDCGGPDCPACPPSDCDAPTGLFANAISKRRATLNWGAVADANDYDVQYREAGTSTWTDRNTSDTRIRITGLRNRTTYEWRVRANCNAGTSDWSVTCEFTAGTSSSGDCGASMIARPSDNNTFAQVGLTAYPNPASDVLNVRLNLASEGNLRMIDITGRTVFEAVVRYGRSTQEINVNNLPKGLYFLELRSEGEVQVEKVVVE
ncbi:MAG: M43 family zinc metalloprotease [Bacteroidota bacterium]